MIMKGNTKLGEERNAATDAKALLCGLTPETARSDRTIFVLRYAANVATKRLDQTSIDEGKTAVQAWLDALSAEDCR